MSHSAQHSAIMSTMDFCIHQVHPLYSASDYIAKKTIILVTGAVHIQIQDVISLSVIRTCELSGSSANGQPAMITSLITGNENRICGINIGSLDEVQAPSAGQ